MLKTLEVYNFCRHASEQIEFKPGMNAIIGPNGSGKSTLLTAVAGCFTGAFDAFPGAKAANVRCTAGPDDKSWVKTTFVLRGGQEAEVTRSLRPAGQKLRLGGRVYTKRDQIQEEIGRWLGMDPKTFVEFAFAFQWELFRIVDVSPGQRAQALHRLFRLDQVEECWEILGKRLISLRPAIVAIDVERATTQLSEDKNRLDRLEKDRQTIVLADRAELERARDLVGRIRQRRTLENELVELRRAIDIHETAVTQIRGELEMAAGALEELEAECRECEAMNAPAELEVWRQRRLALAERDKLSGQLVDLEKQRPLAPELRGVEWTPEDDRQRANLQAELKQLDVFLDTFDPERGTASCPVCHTPARELSDRHAEYSARRSAAAAELEVLQARAELADKERSIQTAYNDNRSRWQTKVEFVRKQLEAVEALMPQAPAQDASMLLGVVARCKQLRAAISEMTRKQSNLRVTLGGHESNLVERARRREIIDQELVSCPSGVGDLEKAETFIRKQESNRVEAARLDAHIEILRETIKRLEQDIAEAEAADKRAKQTDEWRGLLSRVRDGLHRDRLPRELARQRLQQLETGVNHHLEELEIDFRIEVDDDLSFVAYFPDGRRVPAERLSGGEKVVFALAWRLTVNAAFAADVGLLCLDEPTAGLDGERLECLRRALKRLKLMAGSHGLQCIIVTHERSLMGIFDHFIELQA